MKRYEYLSITAGENNNDEYVLRYQNRELNYHQFFYPIMNKLGSEGWELINVVPITGSSTKSIALIPWFADADTYISSTYTTGEEFYFKRELSDKALELNNSVYSEQYKYLEQFDIEDKNIEIRDQLEENITVNNNIEDVIEYYKQEGYHIKFQHSDRLIFEKDMREVRYDRDSGTDTWKIHK